MLPVFLTKIKTRDGISLDGIVVHPKRKSKTALILVHGLGSRFYAGYETLKELSTLAIKNNIAFLKFNNRGHDVVNRDGFGKRSYQGKTFEKFIDCVHDIRAVVREAKRLGYSKIILTGHSTGSNKALYYMYKTRDRAVKALALTGAVSDMAMWNVEDPRKMRRAMAEAKKLARKNPNALLPQEYGLYSAQRYISLFEAGHTEDVFPYHNPRGSWKELKNVRVPVAVIIGSRDKYLDRPAKNLIEIFRKNAVHTKSFSGVIIAGANHGFYKKEKELARIIINWAKTL